MMFVTKSGSQMVGWLGSLIRVGILKTGYEIGEFVASMRPNPYRFPKREGEKTYKSRYFEKAVIPLTDHRSF
jgi:hypothetical protein